MSELESLTESLSGLSDKSSPADIARLFSGSDSPMGHLEEVSKARLEYLQELQNDLVSVRLRCRPAMRKHGNLLVVR